MKAPLRVLLVDDDRQTCSLYAGLLRGEGFEVVTRGDRQSAEAVLTDSEFDFAVLDYELPGSDDPQDLPHRLHGLKLMHFVHERHVPFVILTGVVKGALEGIAAIREGALDYFYKGALDAPDKIVAAIRKTGARAATGAVPTKSSKLPLHARRYQDCYVVLSADDPTQALLAVRGSQARVPVKPTRTAAKFLWEIAQDQRRGLPSSFSRHYRLDSSRRSAVQRFREWLQERFEVEEPGESEAPLVNLPSIQKGESLWACDVRVLDEQQEEDEERKAMYRQEAERVALERKREKNQGR